MSKTGEHEKRLDKPPQESESIQLDSENVEMASQMLSLQIRAHANKPDVDGNPNYD